jgi:hypothetical protein
VQELLRHANSRITLDIYTQAVTPAKRAAQTKVVEIILPKPKEQKELEETLGKARISLSNPSEPTPVEGGVCKCLKVWRGRRDSTRGLCRDRVAICGISSTYEKSTGAESSGQKSVSAHLNPYFLLIITAVRVFHLKLVCGSVPIHRQQLPMPAYRKAGLRPSAASGFCTAWVSAPLL